MKKTIVAIAVLFAVSGIRVSAQDMEKYGPNAAECMKYLSYYDEYYKQKDYDNAIPWWRKAYETCPVSASKNMIIRGPFLVNRLIRNNASNPEYKAALVDTLMRLYDQYVEIKPSEAVNILNNKGIDINKYYTGSKERFEEFEKIIKHNGEETKSTFFSFDLKAAVEEYTAGRLGADSVIEIFQRNSDLASKYRPESPLDSTQVAKVRKDLNALFIESGVASCDKLIEMFREQLKAEPDNEQLVSRIIRTLNSVEDCQSNDFYLQALETLNKLNPEAISSYIMFKIYASKNDVGNAVESLKKAISEEPTKEDYIYEMANYCYRNGRNGEAVTYAGKLVNSPIYGGRALFLMGSIWGALNCGGDEFTAYTHFWIAYDYMAKAKNNDPSLAEDATRYMAMFSSRFPSVDAAFMYNVADGQPYTVSCGGMRASTIVRTRK